MIKSTIIAMELGILDNMLVEGVVKGSKRDNNKKEKRRGEMVITSKYGNSSSALSNVSRSYCLSTYTN